MTITTELVKELAVRAQGRNPVWSVQTDTLGAPPTAASGIDVTEAMFALASAALRENPERYRSRVTVGTLDATAAVTYTVSLGDDATEMDFVFTLSGGETSTQVLEGIRDVINDGVLLTTGNLTYANANPDTIERASGSNVTDGVLPGWQLVIVGGTNPGTYTVAVQTSATVVTLVATDVVSAAGPEAVTSVTALPPVVASVETRNGTPTLVLERRDVDAEIDAETFTFSTNVAASGTGVLAAEEDAETATLAVWMLPEIGTDDGVALMPLGRLSWCLVNNADAYSLDYRGFIERFETSGAGRLYGQVTSPVGVTTGGTPTVTVAIGPCGLE